MRTLVNLGQYSTLSWAISCALSIAALTPLTAAARDDWYQVEIIVFTLKNPEANDEIWPLSPISYPSDVVSIESQNGPTDNLFSLTQLNELLSSNTEIDSPEVTNQPSSEFLFANRSRFSQNDIDQGSDETQTNDSELSPEELAALFAVDIASEPFKALPDNMRYLNSLARSINRSSLYTLQMHKAWLQPVRGDVNASPVLIQAGEHRDDYYEIDGTITISRSRYLHLSTDLWYTTFTPKYGDALSPAIALPSQADDYPNLVNWEKSKDQYLPVHTHRMSQRRRMRSATLHYIDHPYFGILIQINEAPAPGAD